MKGIIFNLLESTVTRQHGEDLWDTLLEETQLDGVYTALGSYPDEELMKLVGAATSVLNLPSETFIRWFGRNALPILAERYPEFFEGHNLTRDFLLTLNDIIHPEVRKIYQGADVPQFTFDLPSDDVLVIGYRSARKLCSLAEGLIEGATAHYGEDVVIEQPSCMKRGDDECILVCSFKKGEQSDGQLFV